MQAHRKREAKQRLNRAGTAYVDAIRKQRDVEIDPAAFGFELSFEQIKAVAAQINPSLVEENDALRLSVPCKAA